MTAKIEHLVVDTSAFIKNVQLQNLGENVVTVEEVANEIKNTRQLRRLIVLPYDLQMKYAEPENVALITNFAKKTGDYPALSATDIKVLALTYQLEKELVGTDHLRTEPIAGKSIELVDHSVINATDIIGFYLPENGEKGTDDESDESDGSDEDKENSEIEIENNKEITKEEEGEENLNKSNYNDCDDDGDEKEDKGQSEDGEQEVPEVDDEFINQLNKMTFKDEHTQVGECDQNDPCALDDDDAGWITPGNILKAKKDMFNGAVEEKHVKVACLTTDFAMQNVLKQMGLNMVSLDGLVINEVRTFILRCYACFKTTSIMTKVFCPNCGNKTLKRVAVTVDKEGKEHVHINFRRPLTAKGKRFPLPRFHGGKHSNNPILSEDQQVPQQRLSKLALKKNNPLDSDYIAGISPFVMRDVCSKSAVLGVQRKVEVKSWMRRNPNEVVKRRRKK